MMPLLTDVVTKAQALTAGQLFTSQQGGLLEIVYHQTVMPPRDRENSGEDAMPFCLVRGQQFAMLPQRAQKIELLYALHNDDRQEAQADLGRLFGLLEPLATKLTVYPGWKLAAVGGWFGDRESGLQPHPEYYMWVVLDFAAQLIRTH